MSIYFFFFLVACNERENSAFVTSRWTDAEARRVPYFL